MPRAEANTSVGPIDRAGSDEFPDRCCLGSSTRRENRSGKMVREEQETATGPGDHCLSTKGMCGRA